MKLSVTLVCFFLAGCGSSSPFELEQVEGNVAYSDGSRIEADQLLVKFVPQGVSIQGKDAPRAAETYADTGDGSFKNLTTWKYADGVMVGRHKVVVMSLRVNSHGVGEPTNAVPIRYQKASTTPLEVEVTSASKVFSFKIEKDS